MPASRFVQQRNVNVAKDSITQIGTVLQNLKRLEENREFRGRTRFWILSMLGKTRVLPYRWCDLRPLATSN